MKRRKIADVKNGTYPHKRVKTMEDFQVTIESCGYPWKSDYPQPIYAKGAINVPTKLTTNFSCCVKIPQSSITVTEPPPGFSDKHLKGTPVQIELDVEPGDGSFGNHRIGRGVCARKNEPDAHRFWFFYLPKKTGAHKIRLGGMCQIFYSRSPKITSFDEHYLKDVPEDISMQFRSVSRDTLRFLHEQRKATIKAAMCLLWCWKLLDGISETIGSLPLEVIHHIVRIMLTML